MDRGLHFALSNEGRKQFAFSCMERHADKAGAPLDVTLPKVELADGEGTESPLGQHEPAESKERPMWDVEKGADGEGAGSGSVLHDKNAGITEAQLNDALALM